MFLEVLEKLFTPCPRSARVMGYLREVVGIGARYRRCQRDWQPHLDRSRAVICRAIERCPTRRRAVVLGSGRLYDVPLEELAGAFGQVVLVDLVHPWPVRWRCRRLPNVHLLTADVTGVLEPLQAVAYPGGTLPTSTPTLFLDDPTVDLVVSLNILSQLPIIPCRYLERWNRFNAADIERFGTQLMQAHIDYLRSFNGTACVLADVGFLTVDENEVVIEEADALRGLALPWTGEEWIWRLAPGRNKSAYCHRVRGVISR